MSTTQATPRKSTRQPVRALNKSAEAIAANSKAEADRKAASKAALHATGVKTKAAFSATMTAIDGASRRATFKTIQGLAKFIREHAGWPCDIHGNKAVAHDGISKVVFNGATEEQIAEVLTPKTLPRVKTQAEIDAEQAAYLKTLAEDARAVIGEDATEEQIAAYVKAQLAPATKIPSQGYQGPMLALRDAAKHYTTGKNGNPHCNDMVAELLQQLSREQTVDVLGHLLFDAKVTTAVNPYITLNPGQQSMNLRNKLRGALKNGTVKFETVEAAVIAKMAA